MWNVKTKSLPQVTNDIELMITRASYREALLIPTNNVENARVVYCDKKNLCSWTGYILWREIIQFSYTDLESNNLWLHALARDYSIFLHGLGNQQSSVDLRAKYNKKFIQIKDRSYTPLFFSTLRRLECGYSTLYQIVELLLEWGNVEKAEAATFIRTSLSLARLRTTNLLTGGSQYMCEVRT